MNVRHLTFLTACGLLFSSTSSNATVTIILVHSESQVSTTAAADVALEVTASSNKPGGTDLTVGAGYTLTCDQGVGEHKEDNANTFSDTPMGTQKGVTAADIHLIGGYATVWEKGSTHQCTVKFRGRAAEGATGTANSGYDFVFQVGSLVQGTLTTTGYFPMRKPMGPGSGGCNP